MCREIPEKFIAEAGEIKGGRRAKRLFLRYLYGVATEA
jgi:hypothetical protein